MDEYITIIDETVTEFTEKRSRFIATVRHCDNEEQAIAFIDEMRAKYWDAKHNVFAYSVGKGAFSRFSDDGEPHGTAGKPVFDVLKGSGLTDAAVVVTRYFGGILLGTGGLVRAYSQAARNSLEQAPKAKMLECTVLETVCEYYDHNKLTSLIEECFGRIDSCDFTDKVRLRYIFKNSDISQYLEKLSEAFSARIIAEKIEERVLPYEI